MEIFGFLGVYLIATVLSVLIGLLTLDDVESENAVWIITGAMAVMIGTGGIVALGSAPWQEAGTRQYESLQRFHDTNDTTIALSKEALADGVLTNLEYNRIGSVVDDHYERMKIEDAKEAVVNTEYHAYPVERLRKNQDRSPSSEASHD
jgi:hypothetical protein